MKPFITALINERLYRLRLTMGVILEYEQITENKLCEINFEDSVDMSCMLWLMMRRESPSLTYESAVSQLTKTENKTEVFIAVRRAINNAFTDKKSNTEDVKPEYFDFNKYSAMAAEIGVKQSELWELTPAEFFDIQSEHIKKIKRQHNDLFTQAWYTAYFSRVNNMPDLQKYLVEIEPEKLKREQTPEEMMEACRAIFATFGEVQ